MTLELCPVGDCPPASAGATEADLPALLQPQLSVLSGQGNPQIRCVVRGGPIAAHVLSWYQQRQGRGPAFLLSQRHGAAPTYGVGVNPRFLAEMDLAQNAARLTVGNASPADEGVYYCAMWISGLYIFGEGTRLLYQGGSQGQGAGKEAIEPSGAPLAAGVKGRRALRTVDCG